MFPSLPILEGEADPPLRLSPQEREERFQHLLKTIQYVLSQSGPSIPRTKQSLIDWLRPWTTTPIKIEPEKVFWELQSLGVISVQLPEQSVNVAIKSHHPLPIYKDYAEKGLTVWEIVVEKAKRWCFRTPSLPTQKNEFMGILDFLCTFPITFEPEEILNQLVHNKTVTVNKEDHLDYHFENKAEAKRLPNGTSPPPSPSTTRPQFPPSTDYSIYFSRPLRGPLPPPLGLPGFYPVNPLLNPSNRPPPTLPPNPELLSYDFPFFYYYPPYGYPMPPPPNQF